MIANTHFDRWESEFDHYYTNNRGTVPIGGFRYDGYLKCKLVHSEGFSILIPDLLYIMQDETDFSWFQFYSFLPNLFGKFSEDEIYGTIFIDIAFGNTLKITISSSDHVTNFDDHSNLFKCIIQGPENLVEDYSTGLGKLINDVPYIYLYHHTSPDVKELILQSKEYRGSLWNYQGTKKLGNICYAYFTSLDKILTPNDLKMIAMASDGMIQLQTDETREIISIPVYRENTTNRQAALKQLIDSTIILNNHIWMHEIDGIVHYEVCSAFIYRIGLENLTLLPFVGEIITRVNNIKTIGYIVLGDATIPLGLVAPFDEEYTTFIFKIELFFQKNSNILKFWFDNGNLDLYSGKEIEEQIFQR